MFAVLLVGWGGCGPPSGGKYVPNTQCTLSGGVTLSSPCEVRVAPLYGGAVTRSLSVVATPDPNITVYTDTPLDAGRTTREVCDALVVVDAGTFTRDDCVVEVVSAEPLHGTVTVRLTGPAQRRATLSTTF